MKVQGVVSLLQKRNIQSFFCYFTFIHQKEILHIVLTIATKLLRTWQFNTLFNTLLNTLLTHRHANSHVLIFSRLHETCLNHLVKPDKNVNHWQLHMENRKSLNNIRVCCCETHFTLLFGSNGTKFLS